MNRLARYGLIAVALAFAGCGGTDSPHATRTRVPTATATTVAAVSGPLTHDEFIRRLDGTCRGGTKELADLLARVNTVDLPTTASVLTEIIKRSRPWHARQRALRPPPQDREAFDRYLATQRRYMQLIVRMKDAAAHGDVETMQFVGGVITEVRTDRAKAAADLGTRVCGT